MDWSAIKDDIVLGLTSTANIPTDNIDDAIRSLTSPVYSPIYDVYDKVTQDHITGSNQDTYPTDQTSEKSGTLEYVAWDPRLSRVDGFLSKNGSNTSEANEHPIIVPFSSASAAGAFYDLVFHIEYAVDKKLAEEDKSFSNNTESSYTTNPAAGVDDSGISNNDEGYSATEKVYRGQKAVIDNIKSSSESYGIASLVNPYTLTKLCGGLTIRNSSEDKTVETHLYDIRDVRRFYDRSVQTENDKLSITNPTTTNIITFSNRDPWGRTPYCFQDFVFCKYWNIIPNNRLITFRKYHAPVYDNLQFYDMYEKNNEPKNIPFAPIATVVTYFGDETGNTLQNLTSFTTGTKWRDISADIHQVTGEQGSDPRATIEEMFSGNGGFNTGESRLMQSIIGKANLLTGKMFSFGKFVGLLSPDGYNINKDQGYFDKVSQANIDPTEQLYSNKIIGPVNRIQSTKARDAGIVFDHKLSLTCEYVARPIGGVNTKAAMLDILANCMEIASVDAAFWGGGYRFNIKPSLYPFKNTAFKNTIMDDLYAGRIFGKNGALAHSVEGLKSFGTKGGKEGFDWSNVTNSIASVIGETLGAIGEMLNSISNTIFGSATSLGDWLKGNNLGNDTSTGETTGEKGAKKLNSLFQNLNQMWRSQVVQHSVMPSVNGMRALLTGEPVGNWHLVIGNPLNPIMTIGNLICTDMKFEFSDELGPDDFPMELKVTYSIDHGMARDKSGIQSIFNRGNGKIYDLPDFIKASSDYETKVDNYTGPHTNGKNGWYTPKYMNVGNLGASGFQTYKISPPKTLAMNAHTDNIFIAKFTPVDVDAAVSNIKDHTTFFGANPGSRAWIRGTSITRKLMN